MIEKIIVDPAVIKRIIGNRKADILYVCYNLKNNRAFFKTNYMIKRKPIYIGRILEAWCS